MTVDPIVSVLRHYRTHQKITQTELGKRVGLSGKTIQRMECGQTDMKLAHYRAIIRALGLTDLDVSIALLTHEFTKTEDVSSAVKLLPQHLRASLITFLFEFCKELNNK